MGGASELLGIARALGQRCAEREAAAPDVFSPESFADLKRSGLVLAPLPPELGGRGATLVDAVRATETLAQMTPSVALMASMPLGLAGVYAVGPSAAPETHRSAWSAQIDAVAAEYRAGRWYAACNSEKGAGGSLAATKTIASRGGDDVWRLTGEKILASSGVHADYFFSTGKVTQEELPGAGVVEFFFVRTDAPGVHVLEDWDGFGMRPTESQTVVYEDAPAASIMGFPNFIEIVQPLQYWFCLFAAIPLGCASSILHALATPAPSSPALRLRFSESVMRVESLRAYLLETASQWRAGARPGYAARVLRTKTYVTQESTKLCAELFALSGGRHYRRTSPIARALADSFAGTALRPPLPLALDALVENFALGEEEPV
jgi:alkylation response protein AidB-like acyl-CoA dehydrogenase